MPWQIWCEWRSEMSLSDKRVLFTKLLGEFICEAFKQGYKIAIDDAKVKDIKGNGHKSNSLHYLGLAVDFVQYTDQGDWLKDTKDYVKLGHIWESLHRDCCSGIHFDDGGHCSLTHDGRK